MRRETFNTSGALRLDLRLPSGEIEVETVDGDETLVELDSTRDTEEVREVIDSARSSWSGRRRRRGDRRCPAQAVPPLRPRPCGHRPARPCAAWRGRGALNRVGRRSRPGGFGSLDAKTASGDLAFGDVGGRARISSASGDITIERVGGDATVNTASGDVRVGRVDGDAVLRSASGDVAVGDAEGSVSVQTASGDQRIASVASGRVTMQSASGDQHVGIRRGTRVHIDAKTMSGGASSELDVSDEPPSGDGPQVELRATAMSGDIRIVRA